MLLNDTRICWTDRKSSLEVSVQATKRNRSETNEVVQQDNKGRIVEDECQPDELKAWETERHKEENS